MNLSNGIRISGSDLAKLDAIGGTSPEARKRHDNRMLQQARAIEQGKVVFIDKRTKKKRKQYMSWTAAIARGRNS